MEEFKIKLRAQELQIKEIIMRKCCVIEIIQSNPCIDYLLTKAKIIEEYIGNLTFIGFII